MSIEKQPIFPQKVNRLLENPTDTDAIQGSSSRQAHRAHEMLKDLSTTAASKFSTAAEFYKKSHITERQREALYALGFELYSTGNFEQAADIFRLLCFYEPQKARNWIALGGAYQNRREYKAAIEAFSMASLQEPLNPEPKLYMAHSFIDLLNLPAALESVQRALQLCENRGEDKKKLQSRAFSLFQALKSYTHHE